MTSEAMSKLDLLYRKLLFTKFFTKGWGSPENLHKLLNFRKRLSNREECNAMVAVDHPIYIDKRHDSGDCWIFDGHFTSPFTEQLPGVMPEAVQTAKFQMILPKKWTQAHRPICIHLAGTGDHGFWRRRTLMARPLVKENQIGSIILENPFYGCRKPKEQLRSSLQNVSDLFVMGGALVLESLALLNWCERLGFGPLGISGVSMGGHMASLAASSWLKPLSFVPCLSWSTASMVWTQGVLSGAVQWNELQNQYKKDTNLYESELSPLIKSPDQHRWQRLGQQFAEKYPSSVEEMEKLQDSAGSYINSYSKTIPVIGPVLQTILSKLKDSQLEFSIGRLKSLDLHSPNLPQLPLAPEVVYFMRGVMDECTHLGHFSPPVDSTLTIAVTARHDGYIPRDRVMHLEDLWPGCEIRYIDQGHVSAFLFKQHEFRSAVVDSFNRQLEKYYRDKSPSNSDPIQSILNNEQDSHQHSVSSTS